MPLAGLRKQRTASHRAASREARGWPKNRHHWLFSHFFLDIRVYSFKAAWFYGCWLCCALVASIMFLVIIIHIDRGRRRQLSMGTRRRKRVVVLREEDKKTRRSSCWEHNWGWERFVKVEECGKVLIIFSCGEHCHDYYHYLFLL